MPSRPQIFVSHASDNAFEVDLLQMAIETLLRDLHVRVWAYRRDQAGDERNVGESLKDRIRESAAAIMLISPETLRSGATQWMELAYADAFNVPTFILLHRLTFAGLRRQSGVPPLVLASHCTPAVEWRTLEQELRACCQRRSSTDAEAPS